MPAKVLRLARLQRKIDRLPRTTRKRVRRKMAARADKIVDLMKRLVPEGDTGRLKDSIGWTWGRAPKGSISIASITGLAQDMTITIYAGNEDAFYARWQEFGTKHHGATPYFFVSWRAHRKDVKKDMRQAWRESVREEAAR